MPKIISAGIIIFRRTKDGVKFLLLYHGRNYWNFPKGKLESEERSHQAAVREVREETGLKISDLRFVGNFKEHERFFFRRGKENVMKVVILYLAETKNPNIVVSDEHEGYGWFTFSEAGRLLSKYHDNAEILKRAYNFLRSGLPAGRQGRKPQKIAVAKIPEPTENK